MADPTDVAEGHYVNQFQIGHNAFEFVFDFRQTTEEVRSAEYKTRLIASPVCAKLLSEMLVDAIGRYESKYGAIPAASEAGLEGE